MVTNAQVQMFNSHDCSISGYPPVCKTTPQTRCWRRNKNGASTLYHSHALWSPSSTIFSFYPAPLLQRHVLILRSQLTSKSTKRKFSGRKKVRGKEQQQTFSLVLDCQTYGLCHVSGNLKCVFYDLSRVRVLSLPCLVNIRNYIKVKHNFGAATSLP